MFTHTTLSETQTGKFSTEKRDLFTDSTLSDIVTKIIKECLSNQQEEVPAITGERERNGDGTSGDHRSPCCPWT